MRTQIGLTSTLGAGLAALQGSRIKPSPGKVERFDTPAFKTTFDMKTELNILMLEDNVSDAELVQRELRKGGLAFRARCVQTQKAFVKALEHHPPDVILSDHGLPAFNGFEALAVAKQKSPHIPFIFVTGLSGDENEIETFERGAIDYVLKSRLSRLVPVVTRAVREAGERAE